MIKNLADLEAKLGMKAGEFKALYDDAAEKEINIADLEIVKKSDLDTRMDNIRAEAKAAGLEVAVKEARSKYGLDFTGKTVENFAEAFKAKILTEAKIEPNEKVKELTNDFNAMKSNYEKTLNELTEVKGTFKQREDAFKVDSAIMGALPKANTLIAVDEMAILFKNKYKPKLSEDGKVIFHGASGEVLKNPKTLSPMTIDEIVPEFQTPYIKPVEGGGGGVDNPGTGKAGSFEAFDLEMEKAGHKVGSEKYNREMTERIKNKTLIM